MQSSASCLLFGEVRSYVRRRPLKWNLKPKRQQVPVVDSDFGGGTDLGERDSRFLFCGCEVATLLI